MDIKIISALIGSLTAVITFIVSQFLSKRKEKSKSEFEKLDEIIEGISELEREFQKDFTSFFNVAHKNHSPPNVTFVLNKLEALVKIYHPKLSQPIDKVITKCEKYFSKKVQIVNKTNQEQNPNKEEIQILTQEMANYLGEGLEEMKLFMESLIKYGEEKVKKR